MLNAHQQCWRMLYVWCYSTSNEQDCARIRFVIVWHVWGCTIFVTSLSSYQYTNALCHVCKTMQAGQLLVYDINWLLSTCEQRKQEVSETAKEKCLLIDMMWWNNTRNQWKHPLMVKQMQSGAWFIGGAQGLNLRENFNLERFFEWLWLKMAPAWKAHHTVLSVMIPDLYWRQFWGNNHAEQSRRNVLTVMTSYNALYKIVDK